MPQLTYIYYSSAIKNGYESDSTLTFKRREDVSAPTPQTPSEAKSIYSQIQKGGDIPVSGLRMTIPERPKGKTSFYHFLPRQTRCTTRPTRQTLFHERKFYFL